jgi:hypothetical protein
VRQKTARSVWSRAKQRSSHSDTARVIDFYHACRRFRRGEIKAIGFAGGTVRQLRWVLTAATFSPDPNGPEAA